MMKHLKVEVNGLLWVDGDFAEISFTDGPGGVKVEGKTARAAPAASNGGGANLLSMLAGASRARSQAAVEGAVADPAGDGAIGAGPAEPD
jgi:hypothetical protein